MSSRSTTLALAACALLAAGAAPALRAENLSGDAITKTLLREPEFELIAISPDGNKLAIVRRLNDVSQVTVHQRSDMKPIIAFDPGYRGRISTLRWLDDTRLLVGATRIGGPEGFAIFDPIVVIANLDGSRPVEMPWDFFATVEGDPDHVLVNSCGYGPGNKGCNLPQIRRDEFGKLSKKGELVIEGPPDTSLVVNATATTGFAIKWEDDDTAKTYVYKPADKTWSLLNDGSVAGVEVRPLAVSRDGRYGYLQSERKDGPDVIEQYDFSNGTRTVLYADPDSDPIGWLSSLAGDQMLGAFYEPTNPRPHFWAGDHPDAKMYQEIMAGFPGRDVSVLSHSRDNNLMVLGVSSGSDPGAWFLFDRQARKATMVTREFPWIDPATQGRQSAFELKSRDGLSLHGLLTLPPNSSGKNLPLVVVPHGGPFDVVDNKGFDVESQILAQHGYAVVQVNFRGSGGYGRHFEEAGAKQWGRAMQDDVTDATRWAIAQGIADPNRVCIFGISYGGYAAFMAPIREPGLYRCAASFAGPSDLTKLTRWGSQHRDDLSKKWFAKMMGEGDELIPVSPALNADKINVPVLIGQGYRDARVSVHHAEAMNRALSKHKADVQYVEYADTGHFLWLEKYREDFFTRLLALLDRTIGSGAAKPSPQASN